MQVNSHRLGELAVQESDIIYFPQGIPAFPECHRFIVVELAADSPFSFLQSVDEGALSWVAVNPFCFFPDYQFALREEERDALRLQDAGDDFAVLNFVTIRDSLDKATVNLKAPLVINVPHRLGKQVILDTPRYLIQHPLLTEAPGPSQVEEG